MRMLLVAGVVVVAGCVVPAGCATSAMGSKSIVDPTIVAQIKEGKTTREEVKKILGAPQAVDFTDAGNEKLVYFYSQTKIVMGNIDQKTNTLHVFLDKDGIVQRIGQGETQLE